MASDPADASAVIVRLAYGVVILCAIALIIYVIKVAATP